MFKISKKSSSADESKQDAPKKKFPWSKAPKNDADLYEPEEPSVASSAPEVTPAMSEGDNPTEALTATTVTKPCSSKKPFFAGLMLGTLLIGAGAGAGLFLMQGKLTTANSAVEQVKSEKNSATEQLSKCKSEIASSQQDSKSKCDKEKAELTAAHASELASVRGLLEIKTSQLEAVIQACSKAKGCKVPDDIKAQNVGMPVVMNGATPPITDLPLPGGTALPPAGKSVEPKGKPVTQPAPPVATAPATPSVKQPEPAKAQSAQKEVADGVSWAKYNKVKAQLQKAEQEVASLQSQVSKQDDKQLVNQINKSLQEAQDSIVALKSDVKKAQEVSDGLSFRNEQLRKQISTCRK